jgi:hypothetical protein
VVRDTVVAALDRSGWMSIHHPTGFHLLQSIADIIDGSQTRSRPELIVIDAFARGCAGTTIAVGLRDLGIQIPIVLVRGIEQRVPTASSDSMLHVVGPEEVERTVAELARCAAPYLNPPDNSSRAA